MGELLTIRELAALLKFSVRQCYELTSARTRAKSAHPIPLLRINGNLRFSKPAIEAWLAKLQEGVR
jgi:predicted DNA-binding transcriptional regulator AlpA